jgi:hypothetical protein
MKSELVAWEMSLEWQSINGFPEVFSKNISKFSELNWHSDSCKRKSLLLITLKKKCNSYLDAQQAQQFQTHWKNGCQISLGTHLQSLLKSKDSNNLLRMLKKKLQIDSKIGIMTSNRRMKNFHLNGKNLSNSHSRNFWSLDAWDQIELQLQWITSWERLFQKEMNMSIVIQLPTSSKFCILLSWIPPLWLQSISSYHQELIQSSLSKS